MEKKKILFLFGRLKGEDIMTCEDAEALEWYAGKLAAAHWQKHIVAGRLRTVKFLAQ